MEGKIRLQRLVKKERAKIASLQEELARITKDRDQWKERHEAHGDRLKRSDSDLTKTVVEYCYVFLTLVEKAFVGFQG